MNPLWVQLAALAFSAFSVVVATAAFIRAGRRMDKGEAVKLESRLVRLEATVAAVPTQEAVHELALSISTLTGEVKAMNARQDGMVQIVGRLETVTDRQEEHLLKGANK
jgi:uncharacterized coiled-coil protein SlyX